jgi:hypothetical protein
LERLGKVQFHSNPELFNSRKCFCIRLFGGHPSTRYRIHTAFGCRARHDPGACLTLVP